MSRKIKYRIYDHTGKIDRKTITVDVSQVPRPDIYNEAERVLDQLWGDNFDLNISHDPNTATIGIYNRGELRQ